MNGGFDGVGRSGNLYEEALKTAKDEILSGRHRSGESLPNETRITEQLDVSRPMVQGALKSMQSRGFQEVRRGSVGTE